MNINKSTRCRVRLDYVSLVKLALLLGSCAGIFSIPLLFLLYSGASRLGIVNVMIGAPLCGAATGLVMVVLGFPVYSWISAKTDGQVYSGIFQIIPDQDEQ